MYYKRFSPKAIPDISNKVPRAVALGYEPGKDQAPRVLATGQGEIAARIISLARQNGIPIHEDPVLLSALAELDINTMIPPELYAVVAEILAFIYRVHQRTIIR
jgi:flagellar biosynthesis protein